MNSLGSSKVASQAQHYANSKAELMEGMPYTELASQAKTNIAGSSFYEEVIVGNETAVPGNTNIKEKPCRVNVYYGDESIPRATLSFNRYSVSQNESSIPKGTILPWYGKSSDIPEGFALCDGTKGTPDLRNRFLVGAGSNYALGDTGGEDQVTLTGTQIGNHYHYWSAMYSDSKSGSFKNSGLKLIYFSPKVTTTSANVPFPSGNKGVSFFTHNATPSNMGSRHIYSSDFASEKMSYITSLAIGTAAQEPHENRPPYYALYYIMKLS